MHDELDVTSCVYYKFSIHNTMIYEAKIIQSFNFAYARIFSAISVEFHILHVLLLLLSSSRGASMSKRISIIW